MPYQIECDAAIEAALRVAPLIRSHAGQLKPDGVRHKGVHDLVTHVDEEAQHQIIEVLQSAFPEYGILAEEGDTAQDERPAPDGYRWIIDPIDGTTNFIHGLSPFSVSIGLQKGDEMVVGVVYEIGQSELFTATRGSGLFLNGRRVHVSTVKSLKNSLITTGFPFRSHTYEYIDAYLTTLRGFMKSCSGVRRLGSAAVDLAYVACGRLDGFFEMGLSPWDLAAGWLLVEEGNGRVTDFGGTLDGLFQGWVLASNGYLHEAMQTLVTPLHEALTQSLP